MPTEPTAEAQIGAFLGRYTPAIEAQLRDARRRLRARFPRGFELVFDNYNALVFGISCSERASQSFVSIAGYPKWVTLFFLHGATLDDPLGLLSGQGKQVRGIRLGDPAEVDSPAVAALVAQASLAYEDALRDAPPLRTIIKSALAKQRARRPTTAP